VDHPARGRDGGLDGGATVFAVDDGTPMKGKGKQAVPPGKRVVMHLPGGAGYGDPAGRDRAALKRDVERGYLSREDALRDYGIDPLA
jgi:N-methylhydantoinase B